MSFFKAFFGVAVVVILSYWAIQPLFIQGFFPMHDDTQPARVYEMQQALLQGQFPVRWVSNLGYGYGYPIFNFYAPLSYYIGALFALIGFDILLATKLMIAVGVVFAGVTMYLLGKELAGKFGGIVAAVSYVYAPYHALDLYVRGDIAEIWAFSFIPLTFYTVWKLFDTGKWRYVCYGAFSIAGLVLSHNLSALMTFPYLVVFAVILAVVSYKKKNMLVIQKIIALLVLGICISSFYWVPTLTEMKYTNVLSQIGGGADFHDHFVCLSQLWDSPWSFGGSVPGCVDGMSFKLGKINILISGITIFLAFLLVLRKIADTSYVLNPKGIVFVGSVIGFLFSIFLTQEVSLFFWEKVPLMSFFQYPWRFLMLASFFSSLLSGYFVWMISKSISLEYHSRYLAPYVISGSIVVLFIVINQKYFNPQTILPKTSESYTQEKVLKWDISKISDEYLPKHFNKPKNREEIVNTKVESVNDLSQISNVQESITHIKAEVIAKENTDVKLNIAYFPFWHVFVNGQEKNFTITGNGLLVNVPSGRHVLEAYIVSTPVEKISNILSLAGVIGMFTGIIFFTKKENV